MDQKGEQLVKRYLSLLAQYHHRPIHAQWCIRCTHTNQMFHENLWGPKRNANHDSLIARSVCSFELRRFNQNYDDSTTKTNNCVTILKWFLGKYNSNNNQLFWTETIAFWYLCSIDFLCRFYCSIYLFTFHCSTHHTIRIETEFSVPSFVCFFSLRRTINK